MGRPGPGCHAGRASRTRGRPDQMLEAAKSVVAVRNIETPDERHASEHPSLNVVNLPGVTIARTVYQPGWKWSTHVKPVVGTDACQAARTGFILSGRFRARMDDGREYGFGPGDAHVVSAGHDAWVEGDEPCVALDVAFTGRSVAGDGGRCPGGQRRPVRPARGGHPRAHAGDARARADRPAGDGRTHHMTAGAGAGLEGAAPGPGVYLPSRGRQGDE